MTNAEKMQGTIARTGDAVDAVETLMREHGLAKSDAIKLVATERERAVSTIRAAYNRQHPSQRNGKVSAADPVAEAAASLMAARDRIDAEVKQAEEVLKTAEPRRAQIDAALEALG